MDPSLTISLGGDPLSPVTSGLRKGSVTWVPQLGGGNRIAPKMMPAGREGLFVLRLLEDAAF